MTPSDHEVTQLLHEWGEGDQNALDRLLPLIYRELHKMAKRYMRRQNPQHTLQTTAVIHEAYLKLAGGAEHDWESRAHFFGVAAKAMRHVLVDHARSGHSARRGGEVRAVTLDEGMAGAGLRPAEMIALDDALSALAKIHPRKSQVVELRYFAGMSVEEAANVLKISSETVARDWRFAKAFLQREITRANGHERALVSEND
jgi:RNA polymerase sigma factor (TIGR02999 family)